MYDVGSTSTNEEEAFNEAKALAHRILGEIEQTRAPPARQTSRAAIDTSIVITSVDMNGNG